MRFQDVIGQRTLINRLIRMTQSGRVPHAQLFVGKSGTQKLALALAYSQYLNCPNRSFSEEPSADGLLGDSCGHCPSCVKIEQLAHPDLHFFYPNNKTGKMRSSESIDYLEAWKTLVKESHAEFSVNRWYDAIELGNSQGYINKLDCERVLSLLAYRNYEAAFRVIIFWLPEKFYADSATRLLKVIEEPSEGTVFLLISENALQIPATILSRTQPIQIPAIEAPAIAAYLVQKYNLSKDEAFTRALQAKGSLLEADRIVVQSEDEAFFHTQFVDWMRACVQLNTSKMYFFSKSLTDLGRERLKMFLMHSLEKVHRCVLLNYRNGDQVQVLPAEADFLQKFSPFINSLNLIDITREIEEAMYHIERNANGSIVMMDLSIHISRYLRRK